MFYIKNICRCSDRALLCQINEKNVLILLKKTMIYIKNICRCSDRAMLCQINVKKRVDFIKENY